MSEQDKLEAHSEELRAVAEHDRSNDELIRLRALVACGVRLAELVHDVVVIRLEAAERADSIAAGYAQERWSAACEFVRKLLREGAK